jgi:hypothetical protein
VRDGFKEVSEGLPKNALPVFNPKPLMELNQILDTLANRMPNDTN